MKDYTKQKELNTKFPEWKDEPVILADNKAISKLITKEKTPKTLVDRF